jgi:Uma2 family endonuclease
VRISATTVLQPDLLVAARDSFAAENLPGVPLLAVEVLSPSTRHIDLGLKRSRYEAAGCPSYWVVDPDIPSLSAWQLKDGRYGDADIAVGHEALALRCPFDVTVVPSALVT